MTTEAPALEQQRRCGTALWDLIEEAVDVVGHRPEVDAEALRLDLTLRGASAALLHDLQQGLRAADASPPRTMSALLIMHVRGEIEQSDLVRHAGFSKAAASTLVEQLVARQLVTRRGSERDRRIVLLRLTEAGEALFLRDLAAFNQVEQRWAGGLTAAERAMLVQLLVKLVDVQGGTAAG